jgi:hypothetical protein
MCRKHSAALGFGAAFGGAAVAAFLSMGTAHATPDGTESDPWVNTDLGGFEELFGGTGTMQAGADLAADEHLAITNNGDAISFGEQVAQFEDTTAHPIADIIYAIDPSAFQFQTSANIDSPDFPPGDYLIPDDSLGYLATDIDFFLLNPTGLADLLGPIGEILLSGSFT